MISANDKICTSVKGGLGGQRGIWHKGANGITQTMPDYFKNCFWKSNFLKKIQKILQILKKILYIIISRFM
jgi:hypothetical protein